ncbi:uncharacterized protein LOC131681811 isoform X2 [Topomyia yanbarensis]|nr:uncharacterized protein LOC131681811 isoform X2 [Topomyia yanbarensis]
MLPNVRTTLDDCHLRFHKLTALSAVKPIFGIPAVLKEFAHMGAIGWTESDGTISWRCGGTLIWYNFVMTAAHCAIDSNGRQPDVVRFGDLNIYSSEDDEFAQQLSISEIVRHPEHRFAAHYHDIALIKLEKNVSITDVVAPACLWTDNEVRFKVLEAAGWGRTGFAQEQTPVLLKVSLKPINNTECSSFYSKYSDRRLRKGLQDHHICAVDEKMDTCEGDSGGPLQIKLMHNGRVTPFIVGLTSFGTVCGSASPGVYTKVSSYHDWIVDTMKKHGASVDKSIFNATFCALRFVHVREFEDSVITHKSDNYTSVDTDLRHMFISSMPSHLVKLAWRAEGHENCYGVVIDEVTVLTVAQCAAFNGQPVTHILFLGTNEMNVSMVHIHPNYIEGSGYSNIAILSLEQLLPLAYIQPTCIWHDHNVRYEKTYVFGFGRADINRIFSPGEINSSIAILRPLVTFKNSSTCIISTNFTDRLRKGLASEHICTGNDFFLVPKSCELMIGGPIDDEIGIANNLYPLTIGLNQFGRDCGFGEHSVAIGLASHVDWMKTVLLKNYDVGGSSLQFLDPDLHLGDSCISDEGKKAQCVVASTCSRKWNQFLSARNINFCSSTSVICCPLEDIENDIEMHPDIATCPDIVRNLGYTVENGSLVMIGWMDNTTIDFRCMGTIITKSLILTTASCIGLKVPSFVQLLALNESEPNLREVESRLIHSGYNFTDNSNDIALVRLRQPLEWNFSVFPSCLWTNRTHTPLVLSMVYPHGIDPIVMLDQLVIAMYNSDCQRALNSTLHDSQICARYPGFISSCVYAPTVLQWYRHDSVQFVIGLASVDLECGYWDYMLFTRVSSFINWIGQAIVD